MPTYLTQWRDGDLTLVSAANIDEALELFRQTACLDAVDVVELKSPLTFTLTLGQMGKLELAEYTPAIGEAKAICFSSLLAELEGIPAELIYDRAKRERITRIVKDETKLRKLSKLSRRLMKESER